MTAYVALLRAVNVSGTGKLAMADLRAMGEALGFQNVRTYIASGNLLFSSDVPEAEVQARLGARLAAHMGKTVPIMVRSGAELASIVAADPFPDAIGARHLVYFCDRPPPPGTIEASRDRKEERLALGAREIYVDYGINIRDTRLKLPNMTAMTARNINTVRKLTHLLAE